LPTEITFNIGRELHPTKDVTPADDNARLSLVPRLPGPHDE
jgi:hypothetical protein